MSSPVLHVRLGRAELDALDARARADGVHRSDVVRRLIRAGLQDDAATVASGDWRAAARRLEQLAPKRWSRPDDNVLDDLLGVPD